MRQNRAIWCLVGLFAVLLAGCFVYRISGVRMSGDGYVPYHAEAGNVSVEEKLSLILGEEDKPIDPGDCININTASIEELMTLPGIGETLATRIVRYRTYNGAFQEIAHIQDVTGIGDGLYEQIRDLIIVE